MPEAVRALNELARLKLSWNEVQKLGRFDTAILKSDLPKKVFFLLLAKSTFLATKAIQPLQTQKLLVKK